jgi:hypothetical protein
MSVLRVLFEVGSGNLLLLKRIMGFEIIKFLLWCFLYDEDALINRNQIPILIA